MMRGHSIFNILLVSATLVHAIYDPSISTIRPDKYKQRLDFKPLDVYGYDTSTTARPLVVRDSRRRQSEGRNTAAPGGSDGGGSGGGSSDGRHAGQNMNSFSSHVENRQNPASHRHDNRGNRGRKLDPQQHTGQQQEQQEREYEKRQQQQHQHHQQQQRHQQQHHHQEQHGYQQQLQHQQQHYQQQHHNQRQQLQQQQQQPQQQQQLQCPLEHGLFPHPTDCSKYLHCAHGRLFIRSCGPGTVFNPLHSLCDWPYNVDCSASVSFTDSVDAVLPPPQRRQDQNPQHGSISSSWGISTGVSTGDSTGNTGVNTGISNRDIVYPPAQLHQPQQYQQHSPHGRPAGMIQSKHDSNEVPAFHPRGRMPATLPLGVLDTSFNKVNRDTGKTKKTLGNTGLDINTICPRPDGQFPYFKDCGKYLNCWRGRPHLQTCPPRLLFNSATSTCDWPSRVVCPSARVVRLGVDRAYVLVPPPSGQVVRLKGGDVPWAGYVQVWLAERGRQVGSWRLVVDKPHHWTGKDGDVVCKQLGFTRGSSSVSQGRLFGLLPNEGQTPLASPNCAGTEGGILQCPKGGQLQTKEHSLASTVAGVRCIPNFASECNAGGVRWGNKCYYVPTSPPGSAGAVSAAGAVGGSGNGSALYGPNVARGWPLVLGHGRAKQHCQEHGLRLLSIHSQRENHFVSSLLSSYPNTVKGWHSAGVRTPLLDDTLWLWQGSGLAPATSLLPHVNWWPGWNATSSSSNNVVYSGAAYDDPSVARCVLLKDTFPSSINTPEDRVDAGYYWWELGACDERLGVVCEGEPRDIGCILGRGVSYGGSANTTSTGAACSSSPGPPSLQSSRNSSKKDKYFCRNPDGADVPWCYVRSGVMEVCDIPRCQNQPVNVTSPSPEHCPSSQFRCKRSGYCIYLEWRCDGHDDCPDGEDELSCPDYREEFSPPHPNARLRGREVEKWLYTTRIACAARCAQARALLCKAFNFQSSTETCILCDGVAGEAGGLVAEEGWEYHERQHYALPAEACPQACEDGRCYTDGQRCDGRRECRGGEDEADCDKGADFALRLINGTGPHEGRLEVRVLGRWGAVCDDMWDHPDGDVACRQLGYDLGAKEVQGGGRFGGLQGPAGGKAVSVFLMDDVQCSGTEAGLQDCNFAGWGEHDCTDKETASVTCARPDDTCYAATHHRCNNGRCVAMALLCDGVDDCFDGSDEEEQLCQSPIVVRLAGVRPNAPLTLTPAGGRLEGRVEVRYKGVWGTACDDDFGLEEGHVVCRSVGLGGAVFIFKNNTFGPGLGKIWLDDMRCEGHEATLDQCQHRGWGLSNCDHSEDVGVRCALPGDESSVLAIPTAVGTGPGGSSLSPLPTLSPALRGLLPEDCGTRSVEDRPRSLIESPRVVGGYAPRPGAHPWMVGVRIRTSSGSMHWCGGAVLSEDFVLTAAHCIAYPASTFVLRVGDYDNEDVELFEKDFLVERVIKHPEFDKGPFYNNDIAVMKIKRKDGQGISFSERVQPLCLVAQDFEYPPGLNCTVAGWGAVGQDKGFSRLLLSTTLPIIPRAVCRSDRVFGSTRLSHGMFCAGHLEGGIDTCQGDSGGPLVCYTGGRFSAVGITSWGHGCARPNKPGVYTRLTEYLPWLYSVLTP